MTSRYQAPVGDPNARRCQLCDRPKLIAKRVGLLVCELCDREAVKLIKEHTK